MERIRRALERARTERDQSSRPRPPLPSPARRPFARTVPVREGSVRAAGLLQPGAAGAVADAFGQLRAQVLQRLEQRGTRTLAVTSAAPRDGRTFVAINLAIAIANRGDGSSLLVDLHLRRPRVHERFGFVPEKGVDDCLRGDADLADALVSPAGYAGLVLLPVRSAIERPSDLLEGAHAREFFEAIERLDSNRVVIFDLPPLLDDTDAVAVARRAGAALVVISDEQTRRRDLQRSLELLHDVTVVGTVLNGSRHESRSALAI